MFNEPFAYSQAAQAILFFISAGTTFVFFYYITNLVLMMYGATAPRIKKLFFVFSTGTVLNTFWIYGIYFIGGRISFPPLLYALVTVPNPLFAMLYYWLGIKILGLSKYRSAAIMRNAYLYCMVMKLILRIIGALFFKQPPGPYNYLLDGASLLICAAVNTGIFLLLKRYILRSQFIIGMRDGAYIKSLPVELLKSFLHACFVYGVMVGIPILLSGTDARISSILTLALLGLLLAINILIDYKSVLLAEQKNKDAYIASLANSIDNFSGIKHDFFNILQTYSGYLQINDLEKLSKYHEALLRSTLNTASVVDFSGRLHENPPLISLLTTKLLYAEKKQVKFYINLLCDISDLYMDHMDLCRVCANLLDNAIEAAEESERKHARFSLEEKPDGCKLLIVSNSVKDSLNMESILVQGMSSKKQHAGIGLIQVRGILRKYKNVLFRFTHYDNEFSIYIEMRPL